MTGPGLRRINYGTLPSRQYLAVVCAYEGLPIGATSVDDLLRTMRQMLQGGEVSALRLLLERVGLEWPDPMAATAEAHRKAAS